jgi:hypothetical protein
VWKDKVRKWMKYSSGTFTINEIVYIHNGKGRELGMKAL